MRGKEGRKISLHSSGSQSQNEPYLLLHVHAPRFYEFCRVSLCGIASGWNLDVVHMRSKNNLHAEVSTSTLDWASSLHSWVNSLSTGRSNPSDRIPHTRSLSFDSNDDEFEMTQTYGVASERSPEPSTAGFGEESRALLGNDTAPVRQRAEGHANIISSVSNLANTIIGSGMCRQLLPMMLNMKLCV